VWLRVSRRRHRCPVLDRFEARPFRAIDEGCGTKLIIDIAKGRTGQKYVYYSALRAA
jgi:hypothetical protein